MAELSGYGAADLPPKPAGAAQLLRLRYQFLGAVVLAVIVPVALRWGFYFPGWLQDVQVNTAAGSALAILFGIIIMHQMEPLPGVRRASYIVPAMMFAFGVVLLIFFFARIDYNRFLFPVSLGIAIVWLYLLQVAFGHLARPRLLIVPGGDGATLLDVRGVDWAMLSEPRLSGLRCDGIVADLRADLPEDWTRFVADAVLQGVPVYHVRQVQESLTGRVEIAHLSENTLGSLNPASIYMQSKQLADWLSALVLLPLLLPLCALLAIAIKLDSKGPILFTQKRIGFRGEVFTCYKFRTMRMDDAAPVAGKAAAERAMTRDNDPRITRIGRWLRPCRIDELPQVINILRGEMSWVGPRPEAVPLSELYARKLPFYQYRHIVPPGITGWVQVNQGHVVAVDQVQEKLHYDFYYIKNFSFWLDMLILFRTIGTVITGFGAR
ncbi:Sugar transferase involved in LPS biosynthesis (colanic, teichoic acid) [Devosia enhydra]|uniref:Sugar transferase involved in LPS biosynthesis (Colanic, teichoic acid) n=1 Tax=Devosia enhydra TaxID=665118 RepID=A0A1K2HSA9_9HYPH|nr:sugar transferase [Devosia enhydra]SFZ80660.1 Sugar transferase involved in LPS biosynthesis (colanic, teichoic acid) [Devosia enhydra]